MGQLLTRRLWTVLKLTIVIHTIQVAGVYLHSRLTDRSAGRWLLLTFVFGFFGVLGYILDR